VGGSDTKLIRVHAKIAMNEAFDVIHGISQEQSKGSHHHHKTVTFANASNTVDMPIYFKANDSDKCVENYYNKIYVIKKVKKITILLCHVTRFPQFSIRLRDSRGDSRATAFQ
jgi:hypothetical protein